MIKIAKYASIGALAFLGSCASLTGGLSPAQIAIITQIQAGAVKVCGYMPFIESVAAMLTGGASTQVDSIVNAICSAVTPAVAAKGPTASRVGQTVTIVVNGKVVTGVMTR